MKARIDKLLRQRDLLREHLNWIEEEIAQTEAKGLSDSGESSATFPVEEPASATEDRVSPKNSESVDSTNEGQLPELDVRGVQNEVRTGCLIYFGIASAAFGLLIAYIYWRY